MQLCARICNSALRERKLIEACRIYETELHSAIDARAESLQTLRELGPPDLVHLIKQPIKSASKQVGVYHHVTGIDASSSASLAAYINTLTYSPHDKQHKVVSGLYWYGYRSTAWGGAD